VFQGKNYDWGERREKGPNHPGGVKGYQIGGKRRRLENMVGMFAEKEGRGTGRTTKKKKPRECESSRGQKYL